MVWFETVKERVRNPKSKLGRWLVSRRVSTVIVLAYLVLLSWGVGSWLVFLLVFPLYWQVYLKGDLTPEWW